VDSPDPALAPPLHLLPLHLDTGWLMENFLFAMLPWGCPSLLGIAGATAGGPTFVVCYESPVSRAEGPGLIDKESLERLHLDRYQTDVVVAGGTPYARATRGADPPDFSVTDVAGATFGLECTQLTLSRRRLATAAFDVIRQAIAQEPRSRFLHLAGWHLYMWFRSDAAIALGLPPRPADRPAIEAILAALDAYRPGHDVPLATELPDSMPAITFAGTTDGARFYAVPMINALPLSLFFAATGFELGLAYSTTHTAQDGWDEIMRLVADHDRPGVDHLLVSVGAPNSKGMSYLAECFLLDFMLAQPHVLTPPVHIRRISVHSWPSGSIVELLPTPTTVARDLYPGGATVGYLPRPGWRAPVRP
jgi:hypothetical protein